MKTSIIALVIITLTSGMASAEQVKSDHGIFNKSAGRTIDLSGAKKTTEWKQDLPFPEDKYEADVDGNCQTNLKDGTVTCDYVLKKGIAATSDLPQSVRWTHSIKDKTKTVASETANPTSTGLSQPISSGTAVPATTGIANSNSTGSPAKPTEPSKDGGGFTDEQWAAATSLVSDAKLRQSDKLRSEIYPIAKIIVGLRKANPGIKLIIMSGADDCPPCRAKKSALKAGDPKHKFENTGDWVVSGPQQATILLRAQSYGEGTELSREMGVSSWPHFKHL